jgi:NAD+ diphosphatase
MLRLSPNTYANYPLDKAGHHRKDEAWLVAAINNRTSRFTVLNAGKPSLRGEGIAWVAPQDLATHDGALFLGVDKAGVAHFAVQSETAPEGAEFIEMRPAAALVSSDDAAILGCARSLFEWHGRHKFCANCGVASVISDGGWRRDCPACKVEHFPRVDPVVIMLALYEGKCLLGRSPRFAGRFVSTLAGFVEPGESLEEACARELFEEAGVIATRVWYHSSQPWPFPSSMMIGLFADVSSAELKLDPAEIVEAHWFTREDARQMLAKEHPVFSAPPPFAIAHHLIKAWVNAT